MSHLTLRKIRRWAVCGTVLAVTGMMVHSGVAVGIIFWSGQPSVKFQESGTTGNGRSKDYRWTLRNESSIGRSRVVRTSYTTEYVQTGWCGVRDPHERLTSTETALTAGFPFKAFEASWTVSREWTGKKAVESYGLIAETPATPFFLQAPAREFPVTPSWPGFIANSGICAVLLGLMWRLCLITRAGRRFYKEESRA